MEFLLIPETQIMDGLWAATVAQGTRKFSTQLTPVLTGQY
jgi:hypothetical protein